MMQDTLFDEFVIAHVLGWWGKAIMVRNLPLLWVLSIGFEVMEVGHLYAGLSLPSSFLLGMGSMWKPNSKCLFLSRQFMHVKVKVSRVFKKS